MCIVCVCVIVVRTDWSDDGAQCVRLHCLFFALGDSDDGICTMDGDDVCDSSFSPCTERIDLIRAPHRCGQCDRRTRMRVGVN